MVIPHEAGGSKTVRLKFQMFPDHSGDSEISSSNKETSQGLPPPQTPDEKPADSRDPEPSIGIRFQRKLLKKKKLNFTISS
jgi:hypothetical protein